MKREKELGEGESLEREIQSSKRERDIPLEGENHAERPWKERESMEKERDLGEHLDWEIESAWRGKEIWESAWSGT